MDLDELLDEDGNGVDIVFANTTTDGLLCEVTEELRTPYKSLESTDVPQ